MKTHKRFLAWLVLVIGHTSAAMAQQSQEITPTEIKWLQGNWKGVGYERKQLFEPAKDKRLEVQQAEFTLSFDHSARILKLTSKSQEIVRTIETNSEYQRYDGFNKRLVIVDLGPDQGADKSLGTKLSIEWISDGQLIFSLVYERRIGSDSFIASGALMLTR